MAISKEQARERIAELVKRYDALPEKRRKAYNEAEICKDYILPMFAALGWDTTDSDEVAAEVRVNKNYADYGFRLERVTRFFTEAKAPSADLEQPKHAVQAVSYAWSKGIPWAVLTDFQGFKLFNAEWDVKEVNRLRVLDIPYTQYVDQFDELWKLSRQSVKEDGIRKGFESRGGAVRKALPVGDQLFGLFRQWRVNLLKMFQFYNTDRGFLLGQLDEAVQRVLDRLIFIRTLEDRYIENPILREILNRRKPEGTKKPEGEDAWTSLQQQFRWLDEHYDSNLFRPHLADELKGDETVVLPILRQLYTPNGAAFQFDFNAIEADVLGRVYEQYLGHVAQTVKTEVKKNGKSFLPGLEPANADTVELINKQAKRKQQGIYYTPKYIVDYIVEQTLGRLLTERGGDENWLKTLTVLDPACGSGSFLIAAYDRLLRHYAEVRQLEGPEQLEQDERVAILTRHIYGVDLDPQAVEIARLNLVLRALKTRQLLPELDKNIVRGNSLISGDAETLEGYFGKDWRQKHPLNWAERFPEIMARGGFDVVIGNPPYDVLEKDRKRPNAPHSQLHTFVNSIPSLKEALGGKLNLYRFFTVLSVDLTKNSGWFGMIVPLSIMGDISTAKTRAAFLDSTISATADCFPQKDTPSKRVFENAKLSTVVLIAQKKPQLTKANTEIIVRTYPANSFQDKHKKAVIAIKDLKSIDPKSLPIPLVDEANWKICKQIYQRAKIKRFGNIKDIIINRGEINQTTFEEFIVVDQAKTRLVKGVEIGQFHLKQKLSQGIREWFDEAKFLEENEYRSVVDIRRIATQRITGVDERLRIVATVIQPKAYFADSTNSIYIRSDSKYKLEYLLGILNSWLMQWRFKLTSTNNNVGTNELMSLPFRVIDFTNADEQDQHDKVVTCVKDLLSSHLRLQELPNTDEYHELVKQMKALEAELNRLVYELYGLTDEEIAIVEGR